MPSGKTTVAQFLERWLQQVGETQVSPRSYRRYAEIARKDLIPALGAIRLANYDRHTFPRPMPRRSPAVAGTAGWLYSPRSVHHMHRILKQGIRKHFNGELTHNPADAVKHRSRSAADGDL